MVVNVGSIPAEHNVQQHEIRGGGHLFEALRFELREIGVRMASALSREDGY